MPSVPAQFQRSEPISEAISSSGAAEARECKRRRLRGKQPAPDHHSPQTPPLSSSRAVPAQPASAAPRGAPVRTAASSSQAVPALGVRVSEAGTQVLVHGDGWGGGSGEYLATVTETDAFTYTIIRQYEDGNVEETHVLREHCNVVC